jgi:NADPH:quinone reductase-like Zn-dependent oxidoreductase
MQAVRLTGPGGARDVEVATLPVPEPGPDEALVRVHAAAVTRDELTWPTDRLPAIPSYELSGVVETVGADVTEVAAGDEIWALTPFDRDGVAAEYAVVPAAALAPRPTALSHVEAAALPLPGLSAWQGLVEHGALQAGERVRITGAGGGVGHVAVQIARHLGAEVVAGGAADLLFDTAGGLETIEADRVVSVAEEPPAGGTYFVVEPNRAQLAELARLVADGKLRPEIDSVFALADARAAFERTEARGKRGKVVLRIATFD